MIERASEVEVEREIGRGPAWLAHQGFLAGRPMGGANKQGHDGRSRWRLARDGGGGENRYRVD
jgi:hypothetical protein